MMWGAKYFCPFSLFWKCFRKLLPSIHATTYYIHVNHANWGSHLRYDFPCYMLHCRPNPQGRKRTSYHSPLLCAVKRQCMGFSTQQALLRFHKSVQKRYWTPDLTLSGDCNCQHRDFNFLTFVQRHFSRTQAISRYFISVQKRYWTSALTWRRNLELVVETICLLTISTQQSLLLSMLSPSSPFLSA